MSELTATTSDGIRLRVQVEGSDDGPPLLLCNSLGTDRSLWDRQVASWSDERLVIRFDQRGHGASEAPAGPYSYERLGRDAAAVLDTVGVDRADLCGISLGGAVALWLAAHHPDRVARLVVADTAARIGDEEAWRSRAALVREDGMAAVAELVVERFFSAEFRNARPDVVDTTRRGLLNLDPEGYAASCEALATGDLRDDVRSIAAPTLVLVGTGDDATPPADAHDLQRRVAGACLHEFDGAGHLANLEQPLAFSHAVTHFLSTTPTAGINPGASP